MSNKKLKIASVVNVAMMLVSLRDRIAKLLDHIESQDREIAEWEEKEAAICPEDVGFVEFIKCLKAEIARKDETLRIVESLKEKPE